MNSKISVFVYNKLNEVISNVYKRGSVGDEPEFPLATYSLPDSSMDEMREDFTLEIDIYDCEKDGYDVLTAIEALTDRIEKSLKNLKVINNFFQASFYKLNRFEIDDPKEKASKRRQLRYQIKYYTKEV